MRNRFHNALIRNCVTFDNVWAQFKCNSEKREKKNQFQSWFQLMQRFNLEIQHKKRGKTQNKNTIAFYWNIKENQLDRWPKSKFPTQFKTLRINLWSSIISKEIENDQSFGQMNFIPCDLGVDERSIIYVCILSEERNQGNLVMDCLNSNIWPLTIISSFLILG